MTQDLFKKFTLNNWIEYIQKQHWRSINLNLDRVNTVWKIMGNWQPKFVVTVAGTNGKGSSVSMLDSAFQEGGKVTGSYTSPHLVNYNERIKVRGKPVSDREICYGFYAIQIARKDIPLTYFEFSTLCALWVFRQCDVDIAILEVGMGGRLDAVNIIRNDIALITCIDMDHQKWLGDNREEIAREKAGIIKWKGKVVCSDPNPPDSIKKISEKLNATLLQSGTNYFIENNGDQIIWRSKDPNIPTNWRLINNLPLPFNGEHQLPNLGGVVATLALSSNQTGIALNHLKYGIKHASISSRCSIISKSPQIIVDVAHNKQSATALSKFVESIPHPGGLSHAILGVLEDKNVEDIVSPVFDKIDIWYLVTLPGERGQSSQHLHSILTKLKHDINAMIFKNPVSGYECAKTNALKNDRIIIFGSFCTAGDIISQSDSLFSQSSLKLDNDEK